MISEQSITSSSLANKKCFSWSAVMAGALVGIGLNFLINLFGAAIGITAFTINPEGDTSLAVGGYIGIIIGAIASMFVAGWVAGWVAGYYGRPQHNMGILYGFCSWCVILIATILLTSYISPFISSHYYSMINPSSLITKITTDRDVPLITEKNITDASTSIKEIIINAQKAAPILGKSLLLIFILLLLSSMASCFGGYAGFRCYYKEGPHLGDRDVHDNSVS